MAAIFLPIALVNMPTKSAGIFARPPCIDMITFTHILVLHTKKRRGPPHIEIITFTHIFVLPPMSWKTVCVWVKRRLKRNWLACWEVREGSGVVTVKKKFPNYSETENFPGSWLDNVVRKTIHWEFLALPSQYIWIKDSIELGEDSNHKYANSNKIYQTAFQPPLRFKHASLMYGSSFIERSLWWFQICNMQNSQHSFAICTKNMLPLWNWITGITWLEDKPCRRFGNFITVMKTQPQTKVQVSRM